MLVKEILIRNLGEKKSNITECTSSWRSKQHSQLTRHLTYQVFRQNPFLIFFQWFWILLVLDKCPHKFNCKKNCVLLWIAWIKCTYVATVLQVILIQFTQPWPTWLTNIFYNGILKKNTEASWYDGERDTQQLCI